MNISLECLPCFLNQNISVVGKLGLSRETAIRIVRRVMAELNRFEQYESTITMARSINHILQEETGLDDPYRDRKKKDNQWMIRLMDDLPEKTEKRPPFDLALRMAVAGNIIDLGANPNMEKQQVLTIIESIVDADFFIDHGGDLKTALDSAETILYIGDNAGEIVFDKRLISLLPLERVTFVVRGGPVLNDITREDAEEVGIHELVRVIDTGVDVPGVLLSESSDEFLDCFRKADLIIAKGQGNFESLYRMNDKRIFFLFISKCQRVADMMSCRVGDYIILDNRQLTL